MRCEEEREEEDHETTTYVHQFTKHDLKHTRTAATNKLRNLHTAGTREQRCREITETTMNGKKRRERSITHTEQKERSQKIYNKKFHTRKRREMKR